MEFFKKIRIKASKALLMRKTIRLHRKPCFINLANIRTVGILWDATNTDDFRVLSGFHQKMQERKVDLKILGYYPGKELPDQYTALRFMTCLKKQDIDFLYRPVTREAISFINQKFDVLIDINFKKQFPLFYISSLSLAGMKVGLADSEAGLLPFDLMIALKGSSSVNVENYLNQVLHYLDMINSEPDKKAV